MTYMVENENAALVVPARFLGELHPHYRELQAALQALQTQIDSAQQQIDTALRELQPTLQATTLSLPEPSTPFMTLPSFVETTVSAINSPSTEVAAQAATGRPFFNGPSDRYEWLMRNQDQWTEADGTWLRNYTASESYADLRDYYEGRGLGWNDAGEAPGFKSAL